MKRDKNGLAIPRPYTLGNSPKSIRRFLTLLDRVPGSYLVTGPDGSKLIFMTIHEYYRWDEFMRKSEELKLEV